jgi:hypothetical protein
MWLILPTHNTGETPLYTGAPISCRESWSSINRFSISNRLTDSATQQVLKLISSHCPAPNLCPQTVHKLKKQVEPMECVHSQYCSLCMSSVSLGEKECGSCIGENPQMCSYMVLPFEEHLKKFFLVNQFALILFYF